MKEVEAEEKRLRERIQEIELKPDVEGKGKEAQKNLVKEELKKRLTIHYDIIEYLKTKKVYYRAFEYNEGEYGKNVALYNKLHNYATRELKDLLKRSLGFFLRSDRNYPQKGFDKQKIFTFDSVNRKEHLWQVAFNTSEIQSQDMYEFLVQQRYHYLRELGNYYNQKNKGLSVGVEPIDPIKLYEELLIKLFPAYKFADKNESIPSNLFIELPSKEVITFNDLSSGEKEVFFILSFFIRHNVENAIIMIDEPELHLHPELSRLLIRNMKAIKNGNQIWMATHNPEIIDEAGRDKVIYISRDLFTRKAEVITGDNEQQVILQLKNMFGFSGYVGVAKNLVFLEGDNSSPDRKFFSTLLPGDNSNFKLVPSNSSNHLNRINSAILSIMEANLGFMNFYLIRDRDYLTQDMIDKYKSHSSGKVFVLSKHELENYLIDFEVISRVLSDIFNIRKKENEIKSIFYEVASNMASDVIRCMAEFRLNLKLKPQNFTIEKVLSGQSYFSIKDNHFYVKEAQSDILKTKFNSISSSIHESLNNSLSKISIEMVISNCEEEVKSALESDEWLNLFPGKELLELSAKKLEITNIVSFQNSIIKEFASNRNNINNEIEEIFNKINTV